MKKFINNLRNMRLQIKKGNRTLSGNDVAEELGITASYYYDLERGRRRLNADLLNKLTKILNCTADDILQAPEKNLIKNHNHSSGDSIVDMSNEFPGHEISNLGADKAWGQLRRNAESKNITPDEIQAILEILQKMKKQGD